MADDDLVEQIASYLYGRIHTNEWDHIGDERKTVWRKEAAEMIEKLNLRN